MWNLPLFRAVQQLAAGDQPCYLPTYSRSTQMRTTLLLAGFYVAPGISVAEKDETTVAATRPDLLENLLGTEWLNRATRSTNAEPLMGSEYVRGPLSPASLDLLKSHPQFAF
jgi:queuine tRNA-ribosyltransferase